MANFSTESETNEIDEQELSSEDSQDDFDLDLLSMSEGEMDQDTINL